MANPDVGSRYTYVGPTFGINNDLPTGTEVSIREIVNEGAEGPIDDHVIFEWEEPSLVQGDSGPEIGFIKRAMSLSSEDFSGLFEGVSK